MWMLAARAANIMLKVSDASVHGAEPLHGTSEDSALEVDAKSVKRLVHFSDASSPYAGLHTTVADVAQTTGHMIRSAEHAFTRRCCPATLCSSILGYPQSELPTSSLRMFCHKVNVRHARRVEGRLQELLLFPLLAVLCLGPCFHLLVSLKFGSAATSLKHVIAQKLLLRHLACCKI